MATRRAQTRLARVEKALPGPPRHCFGGRKLLRQDRLDAWRARRDETHHHGTPIPPPWHPLPTTPRRVAIARRVWWNGPPWTVLRSTRHYLYGIWDWGTREDYRFTLEDVCEELWRRAALAARPGEVSWGNCTLAGWLSGAWNVHTSAPLPRDAHVLDHYACRDWDDAKWHQALAHDAARRERASRAPAEHPPKPSHRGRVAKSTDETETG